MAFRLIRPPRTGAQVPSDDPPPLDPHASKAVQGSGADDEADEEAMTWRHWMVVATLLATAGLWCTYQLTQTFFGSIGVIGLIPVVFLFGTGILTTKDFFSLDWNILMLVGGGAALGNAVKSSRLLDIMTEEISDLLSGQSLFVVFGVFSVIVMTLSNFISHTVAAITTLQVVASYGQQLGHPRLLVFGGGLACCAGSFLPISSFPNVIACSIKDPQGKPYLSSRDFLISGIFLQLAFLGLLYSMVFFFADALGF